MRRVLVTFGLLALSGSANAGEPEAVLTQVLERLDDAEHVAASQPTCNVLVGVEIRKLQSEVKRVRRKPSEPALKGVRKTLTDIIAKTYGAPCPDDVKKYLLSAREPLEAPVATSVATPARAADGTCWSKADPGCKKRRDGHGPMDKASFEALLAKLDAAGGNEALRMSVLEEELTSGRRYVTCRQLAKLLGRFPNEAVRLSLVESSARRVVDPEDAAVVGGAFKPNALLVKQARDLVAGGGSPTPGTSFPDGVEVPQVPEVPAPPGAGDFGHVPDF